MWRVPHVALNSAIYARSGATDWLCERSVGRVAYERGRLQHCAQAIARLDPRGKVGGLVFLGQHHNGSPEACAGQARIITAADGAGNVATISFNCP